MSKRQIILLVVIAVAWFLFRVLTTVPAPLVFNKLNSLMAPTVQIVNPQGSVWKGNAAALNLNMPGSELIFENIDWTLKAWKLLLGQVALDLKSKPADNYINAQVAVGFTGNISASNLDLALPAQLIARNFNVPAKLDGVLKLRSNYLKVADMKLAELDENTVLLWENAGMNMGKQITLGDYQGKLSKQDDGAFKIQLSDNDANLKANGDVVVQFEPLKYNVDLLLEKTDKLPPDVGNMLTYLGKPNADGKIQVNKSN